MGSRVLLFTALGCLWQLVNGENSQNLIPLHAGLQKKLFLTCFLAQFCCFLDYPSANPFISHLGNFSSCWLAAPGVTAHLVKKKLLLQLSQREKRVCLIKPSKQEATEMVHSPPSPSHQPLPFAVTKKIWNISVMWEEWTNDSQSERKSSTCFYLSLFRSFPLVIK